MEIFGFIFKTLLGGIILALLGGIVGFGMSSEKCNGQSVRESLMTAYHERRAMELANADK